MGMDVIGKNPTTEVGEYFRNNVWSWRPLWIYCQDIAGDLLANVSGQYNDGEGLNADGARALAERLQVELAAGRTAEYERDRNEFIARLPQHDCEWCHSTGIRTDQVGVNTGMPTKELDATTAILLGRSHGWCNACRGEGRMNHPETSYVFRTENVARFAEFLADCGGFEIW